MKRNLDYHPPKNIILWSLNILLVILLICVFKISSSESHGFVEDQPSVTKPLFSRGEVLYQKQCAVCHGVQGAADGKAAYLLNPKPRDFRKDKFRLVSTTNMEVTDEDLFEIISRGMPGSAMPSWEHLSENHRWALVYYVRYLSEIENYFKAGEITEALLEKGVPWELKEKMVNKKIDPEHLIDLPAEPEVTQVALKKGKDLFVASCAGCHGVTGRGDGQQKMVDNLGYPVKPRDLTAGIFKGESSSEELYFRMVGGMPGSPMPSYLGVFNQEEIWNLIHYVQTLPKPGMEERSRLKHLKIKSKKISKEIDLNPFSKQWSQAKSTFVTLTPLWWRDDRTEGVEVKTIHNDDKIAFYLKWADSSQDGNLVRVQSFSDGAALQFSAEEDPPFFGMGGSDEPVHIWHWKAAWEQSKDKREDIETEYPHAATDWYESQANYQHGSPFETSSSETQFHDPQYTTGWGAGNPLSNPKTENAAEEGVAEGLGSYTSQLPKMEKVQARGIWNNGKWHVIFVRPLKSKDKKALHLKAGDRLSVAFALWDGSQKDRNGQKIVSIWNDLILEK